jgi:hypothetical protein
MEDLKKMRRLELEVFYADREKRNLISIPHYCPEWDYAWIVPLSMEFEACICDKELGYNMDYQEKDSGIDLGGC